MFVSRRVALMGLAATGSSAILPAVPAHARLPLAGAQALGLSRIKIGTIEVTAISDGFLDIDLKLFSGADEAAQRKLLADSFRPFGPHRSSVNAYVVNNGDRLALIDTGTIKGFAPTLARLHVALAGAGFDPGAFDAVILTHMHPDHAGGLTGETGALFPNAELVVHEKEYGFWTDEGLLSRAPDGFKPFVEIAQRMAKPYAAKVRRFKGGDEVLPGMTAVDLFGHTPGHSGFRISSGANQLLVWGDIIHGAALQFADPKITIGFDSDQEAARATRLKLLDQVVADRLLVAGAHLDFPGYGFVAKHNTGYVFAPAPFGYGL